MARVGFWLGVAAMVLQAVVLAIVLLFFGAALGIGLTTVERRPNAPPVPVVEFDSAPATEPAPPMIVPPLEEFDTLEIPEEVAPPAP